MQHSTQVILIYPIRDRDVCLIVVHRVRPVSESAETVFDACERFGQRSPSLLDCDIGRVDLLRQYPIYS